MAYRIMFTNTLPTGDIVLVNDGMNVQRIPLEQLTGRRVEDVEGTGRKLAHALNNALQDVMVEGSVNGG